MSTNTKFFGNRVAIATFIILFMNMGILGTIGIYLPEMMRDCNLTSTQTSFNIFFATGGAFLSSFTVPWFIKKMGVKGTLLLWSLMNTAHYILYALASDITLVWGGGFMGGFSMGLCGMAMGSIVIGEWFIDKRREMIGWALSAAALGNAALVWVSGQLIEMVGWRMSYYITAGLQVVIVVPLILFFIKIPSAMGQKPLGWERQEELVKKSADLNGVKRESALRTPAFWILFIGIVCVGQAICAYKTYMSQYWQFYGMERLAASNYQALWLLFGTVGIIIGGKMAEKRGNKTFITYTLIAYIAAMILTLYNSTSLNGGIMILLLVLMGLAYPLYSSVPGTLTTQAFGNLDYSRILVMFQAAFYLGFASSPIIAIIKDANNDWAPGYYVLLSTAIVGLILINIGIRIAPIAKLAKRLDVDIK